MRVDRLQTTSEKATMVMFGCCTGLEFDVDHLVVCYVVLSVVDAQSVWSFLDSTIDVLNVYHVDEVLRPLFQFDKIIRYDWRE